MATGDKLASLDDLKVVKDYTDGQITTVNTALAAKAPLASPALTGNPTAPTQTAGNNSTRIATTAFVKTAVDTVDGKVSDLKSALAYSLFRNVADSGSGGYTHGDIGSEFTENATSSSWRSTKIKVQPGDVYRCTFSSPASSTLYDYVIVADSDNIILDKIVGTYSDRTPKTVYIVCPENSTYLIVNAGRYSSAYTLRIDLIYQREDIIQRTNDVALAKLTGSVIDIYEALEGFPLEITGELNDTDIIYITGENIVRATTDTSTVNGVTCTKNGDGTYTVDGTAEGGDAEFNLTGSNIPLPKGMLTITGCPTGGSTETYRLLVSGFGGEDGNGKVITVDDYVYVTAVKIIVYEGVTVDNLVFKPMIKRGRTYGEFIVGKPIVKMTYAAYKKDQRKALCYDSMCIFNDQGTAMSVKYPKYNIPRKVDEIESKYVAIPSYYETHLATKISTLEALDNEIGSNGCRFIFLTDYHDNFYNANNSPALIKRICSAIPIQMCVFGGDEVDHTETVNEMKMNMVEHLKRFDGIQNIMPIIGNHEYYSNYISDESYRGGITNSEVYYYMYKNIEEKMGGTDHLAAYYVDNKIQKIRFYFIGCNYDAEVPATTRQWVIESFENVPDDYRVMLISHLGLKQNANEVIPTFYDIHQAAVSFNSRQTFQYNGRTYDYGNATGTIFAVLYGHVHRDGSAVINDIQYIGTTTDNCFKKRGDTVNVREYGTVSEQAFDVVSISFASTKPKIYMTRIGAGQDRSFDLNE